MAVILDGKEYPDAELTLDGVPAPVPTGLPPTQQTTSYADYDDGYYEKGYVPPGGERFILHGDNTVTDRSTGLMWIRQPEMILPGSNANYTRDGSVITDNKVQAGRGAWSDIIQYDTGDVVSHNLAVWIATNAPELADAPAAEHPDWTLAEWIDDGDDCADTQFTHATSQWAAALTRIANLNALAYAGYSDWRLPNTFELVSILVWDSAVQYEHIDSIIFPNYEDTQHWTSTTDKGFTSYATAVSPHYPSMSFELKTGDARPIRVVRGGEY